MKVLEVIAKTWRDRTYGNTYFAAKVYIDGEFVVALPFQYGYGDQYLDNVQSVLEKMGIIRETWRSLRHAVEDTGAIFSAHKHENCLKREVKAWGRKG